MRFLLTLCLSCFSYVALAQPNLQFQYFDGADTVAAYAIVVSIDTAATNVWQIGKPQKVLFDSAKTVPNAIVTDTVNFYPVGNTSIFSIGRKNGPFWSSILAFRWTQKLDLDYKQDIGKVEFSIDYGATWRNAFTDPLSYNFYGYNNANEDTVNGVVGFTGTDSLWKDIWLCIKNLPINTDSITVRFTLQSDSTDNQKEGWMIDNMRTHQTFIHTIAQTEQSSFFKVFPTPTTGLIFIEATQSSTLKHHLERLELIDASGRVVERYRTNEEKYAIDMGNLPPGSYHLRIFSDQKSKTFPILLNNR
jgi:hypothetical protein